MLAKTGGVRSTSMDMYLPYYVYSLFELYVSLELTINASTNPRTKNVFTLKITAQKCLKKFAQKNKRQTFLNLKKCLLKYLVVIPFQLL